MPTKSSSPKRIVFFHPDLGIGGAERLILDAALALQSLGHTITIYTSHRDPTHCFDEARPNGPLEIRVRGNTVFAATLFGRFKILFSILRQLHLLVQICVFGELGRLKPDVFFVDQLSAGVPFLRWWFGGEQSGTRVLFYCHFPDLLLVQNRSRWWKSIWRLPFDWLEGWGMQGADKIVVNSGFTKGVVEEVWPSLAAKKGKDRVHEIGIVYPCVDTQPSSPDPATDHTREEPTAELWKSKKTILSINRFERKKNIALALHAFHTLPPQTRQYARLVLAGGHDPRVDENVKYHAELVALAESLGLRCATAKNLVTALNIPDDIEVLFLLSVPAQLKTMLLSTARLLVYTPTNEHFGIVPLEAMRAGVPVLAADSGGPLETVVEGETGWLRSVEEVGEWTEIMRRVLDGMSDEEIRVMGDKGKRWVESEFSATKMADRLDGEIATVLAGPRQRTLELSDLLLGIGMAVPVLVALYVVIYRLLT
ncbi:MAG: hypothetical protein L6R37_000802 [Teloschistes peruensis]|nr:MAG: hypothetical protein L6R37_000802 [Teloschistes peruensis]